MLAELRNN